MNNSVTIAYRFEKTLQLCLFDGSKPKNNDELQPRLSNLFKNFDSNGGDDLLMQGFGQKDSQPLSLKTPTWSVLKRMWKLCGGEFVEMKAKWV
ncbi:hypothetical protein Tco_0499448 [Tanacetum coccineum]